MIWAIHGFLGQGSDWDFLQQPLRAARQTLRTIDLFSPEPNDLHGRPCKTLEEWGSEFAQRVAAEDGAPILLGYSLGGRLALHALLAAPQHFRAAIIISAGLGLEADAARAERLIADERWARRFESEAWPLLLEAWDCQPIFGGRKHAHERIESAFDRHALAAALRQWSPAKQRPLAERLGELTMPLLSIAGDDDARYVAEAERATSALPNGELWIAPSAGHRVPWETTEAFTARVVQFVTRHADEER